MKEKIIEILYMESYVSENGNNLSSEDFEEVADKILSLIKSKIYTEAGYLSEAMFNHFK